MDAALVRCTRATGTGAVSFGSDSLIVKDAVRLRLRNTMVGNRRKFPVFQLLPVNRYCPAEKYGEAIHLPSAVVPNCTMLCCVRCGGNADAIKVTVWF
jgi:hypothetical protein